MNDDEPNLEVLTDLCHSLVYPEPGYAKVFGLGFWEDLDANPKIGAQFDALSLENNLLKIT